MAGNTWVIVSLLNLKRVVCLSPINSKQITNTKKKKKADLLTGSNQPAFPVHIINFCLLRVTSGEGEKRFCPYSIPLLSVPSVGHEQEEGSSPTWQPLAKQSCPAEGKEST